MQNAIHRYRFFLRQCTTACLSFLSAFSNNLNYFFSFRIFKILFDFYNNIKTYLIKRKTIKLTYIYFRIGDYPFIRIS